MRKVLRIGVLFFVVAALIVGGAFPVTAGAAAPGLASNTVQGIVMSVASDNLSFIIQNGSQPQVTVQVNQNTKYFIVPMGRVQTYVTNQVTKDIKQDKNKQTRAGAMSELHIPANWQNNLGWLTTFNSKAKFSDIKVGDKVIAGISNADNSARQVLIIKAPVIVSVKGTISAVSANSTTITPANFGTPVTVSIKDNTRITLKGLLSVQVGQYAVAVYNKNTLIAQTINIQATAPAPIPAANLKSITVTSAVSGNLTVGTTRQFVATGTYANGSTINITSQVTWASSNVGVATITNTGFANGVAAGSTAITALKSGITSTAITLNVSN